MIRTHSPKKNVSMGRPPEKPVASGRKRRLTTPRPFEEFDRSRLEILPLSSRRHNLTFEDILPLKEQVSVQGTFRRVAEKVVSARNRGAAVILMAGGHVVRSGVQRYLIDLMEQGLLSCIALNGAGMIHDFEFSLIGATTESVAAYIPRGHFGLWRETGRINGIVSRAAKKGMGLGEAVGRFIEEEHLPFREISLLRTAHLLGIPVTVHVSLGYDIVHEFPNCDGAAYGAASYTDFLRFAMILESLEGGVVMNFGSAIMGPEVYLKALSMARNVARQEGGEISHFTTLVCDLQKLPKHYRQEPSPENPSYYFRPWKTLLVRTVKDGGESYYVRGRHSQTIPQLWTAIMARERSGRA